MIHYDLIGRVLIHPVQKGILEAMECAATAGVTAMSPNELTEQLGGEPIGTVSYHVKVLAGGQQHIKSKQSRFIGKPLLELVRTQPVRGAVEHFYGLTAAATTDGLFAPVDPDKLRALALELPESVYADAIAPILEHLRPLEQAIYEEAMAVA